MNKRSVVRSCASILITAALLACQGTPAPAGPPLTGSAVPPGGGAAMFTATVVYVAPSTWNYTVTSATGSNINTIEIITARNLGRCTLTPPTSPGATAGATASWRTTSFRTPAGATVPTGFADPTGLATVTFSISCDAANGPIYLIITDIAGSVSSVVNSAGASIIGPIAGPT